MDREKAIKEFEHLLNAAKGNYFDFVDLTVDLGEEILAMLKEHDDLGSELTNAVELIHKKNERIKKLLKEQEAVEPNVSSTEQRCGNCNKVIEMDGWIACPWCGKPIAWSVWWNKNGGRSVK